MNKQENKEDLSIGFIGVGVLGKGLPLALAAQGYRVVAAFSRRLNSAQWLASRIPGCAAVESAQELADSVDLVFITTPDSVIRDVAAALRWRPNQGAIHCCGAASTELLEPAADQGAVTGAFHPFQTFAGLDDPKDALARMDGVRFAISGHGWLPDYLAQVARDLGGQPVSIADADRPLYHAAAVLACGHLVALLHGAVDLWQSMGFTAEEAVEALYPLTRATLDNIKNEGLAAAATGPVVRGDAVTVRSHLEALFQRLPELVPVYGTLARASLPLAVRKGIGPDQVTAIEELVDHYVGSE
ncbi:MAG: DUF2520 domain-containing protein [Chloroflexi bacterium]|nr:DUF2520 domain-containing protein [Chloroflexota bacterium]